MEGAAGDWVGVALGTTTKVVVVVVGASLGGWVVGARVGSRVVGTTEGDGVGLDVVGRSVGR